MDPHTAIHVVQSIALMILAGAVLLLNLSVRHLIGMVTDAINGPESLEPDE
jgi:hypothetical protein